jgi:hypothetical protein
VVLVISVFFGQGPTINLDSWRFLGFSPPFLMFGGQNGVITFSVFFQKSTVSNWILTIGVS